MKFSFIRSASPCPVDSSTCVDATGPDLIGEGINGNSFKYTIPSNYLTGKYSINVCAVGKYLDMGTWKSNDCDSNNEFFDIGSSSSSTSTTLY